MLRFLCGCSILLPLLVLASASAAERLPVTTPEQAGFDFSKLTAIEPLIADAIEDKKLPGCVLCFGRRGQIAWLKAYGDKQLEPAVVPMTTDTVFDMASLTKPVATATSIMILVDRGKLELTDRVTAVLPEFASHGKDAMTIEQLLTHQSGLLPDNPLGDYRDGSERAWKRICKLTLRHPVGEKFVYSDVNFIVLGEIVRRVSGRPLDEFVQAEIFQPLGMTETGFLPREELRRRAAPTQQRAGIWLRGEVHDPRAHLLGGVAGHAGLFSTAEDLAVYAQMMLNGGSYQGTEILSPQAVAWMTRGEEVSSGVRGLGWDKRSGYSINRGEGMSNAAFGHGGFTGTVMWIDPEFELFFIFLSNRVHPDGSGSVNHLAGNIATIVVDAIADAGEGP